MCVCVCVLACVVYVWHVYMYDVVCVSGVCVCGGGIQGPMQWIMLISVVWTRLATPSGHSHLGYRPVASSLKKKQRELQNNVPCAAYIMDEYSNVCF